jgi:hypothetical protein
MAGSALWFSRFAQSGEGWLPLVALASSACVFVAVADTWADEEPAPGPVAQGERCSAEAATAASADSARLCQTGGAQATR